MLGNRRVQARHSLADVLSYGSKPITHVLPFVSACSVFPAQSRWFIRIRVECLWHHKVNCDDVPEWCDELM